MSRPVLVLRAEPQASLTADRARALGLSAVAAPLFFIRKVDWEPPALAPDAVLLTSANALRFGGDGLMQLRHLPAYAVGPATAAAARSFGFGDVRTGEGDVTALARRLRADRPGRILHLSGSEVRPFDCTGLSVDRRIAYALDPLDAIPSQARELIEAGAVALVHSPGAGAVLDRLGASAGLDRRRAGLAAISAAAAHAAGSGWRDRVIADAPNDPALLASAARLCHGRPVA